MKYIKYLGGFLLLTIICLPLLSQTKERWKDVNNEYINAHGGAFYFITDYITGLVNIALKTASLPKWE